MRVSTYEDFVAVLEIEIDRLRGAEEYLNEAGQRKLKTYRKIRELTSFAESCMELIEIGVHQGLGQEEKQAAHLALRAIDRIAKAENEALGNTGMQCAPDHETEGST